MDTDINRQIIMLQKSATHFSERVLNSMIREYMQQVRDRPVFGQVSMKHLMERSNGNVQGIEMNASGLQDFNKIARSYGLKYSLMQTKDANKVMCYFSARSESVMQDCFKEYLKVSLNKNKQNKQRDQVKGKQQSYEEKREKAKEIVANQQKSKVIEKGLER